MQTTVWRTATYSLALLAASSSWANSVVDKQFSVQPNELLVVNTDIGSIDIVGSDDSQVTLHASVDGDRDLTDKFTIDATHDNGVVRISGHRAANWFLDLSQWFGGGLHVKYSLSIPRQFKLDIKTAGGNLNFRKIQGSVNAHTSGGNVRVEDIDGDINIHTSGGNMQAEQTHGRLHLRTSGGHIMVRNANGNSDLDTSGGNINLSAIEGEMRARTSGGNIDLSMIGAQSNIELRTSGGNIAVAMPATWPIYIDAHTSGGRVNCDLPVTSTGDHERNTLTGMVNGGGNSRLIARTSGGNIFIRSNQAANR